MRTRKRRLRTVNLSKWQGQFAYLGNWQGIVTQTKNLADLAITAIRIRICLARKLFNTILKLFYLIIKLNTTTQLLAQSFQPFSQPILLPYYLFLGAFWELQYPVVLNNHCVSVESDGLSFNHTLIYSYIHKANT